MTLTFAAVFIPSLGFWDPNFVRTDLALLPPDANAWLGTDALGRDLFSRVCIGARISLSIAVLTCCFGVFLGIPLGALAGWRGGWWDRALMAVTDFFTIIPLILITTLVSLFLGRGFWGIVLSIGLTSWMAQARLVRSLVWSLRASPLVESARALGLADLPLFFRHILPQTWGPLLISLVFQLPTNLMTESFLSFLGLGISPPIASWGTLAAEGYSSLTTTPHLLLGPGLALMVTLLAFQILGNALSSDQAPDHIQKRIKSRL